jgi:DNA-binding MarR family transcriptional regulator
MTGATSLKSTLLATPDGVDLLLRIFEIQGSMTSVLGAVGRSADLGPSEVAALLALRRGPSPISGVARSVGIRPNGASVLVERLHARGLVRRERSRRDNRVVSVELTPSGQALADELSEAAEGRLQEMLSTLTDEQRTLLPVLLARIGA